MASPADDTKQTNVVSGDSGPGTSLLDVLPIPSDTRPITDPDRMGTHTELEHQPSLSHALATESHETKGIAQVDHGDPEVKDLGWNETKEQVPAPLVGGLGNEELWLLVRRFNKQMYHVKSSPYPVPGNLDLNIADDEEFSPDKLRANLERMYTTVIIGLLGAVKHIGRLRSWKETRRTSYFCAAYAIAWAFDFIIPLLSATALALVVYPKSRAFLFPPAPLALVDSSTGGLQKPRAGVLGSHDSATGAPENHKGEAVEQEASNFVNSIASVALTSSVGTHPPDEGETAAANADAKDAAHGKSAGQALPTPAAAAVSAADAKDAAAGAKTHPKHDKTKVPMEQAMWNKMRPVMHGVADVCDTWERFANALAPTPPFPGETSRLRLATMIIPIFGLSLFTSSYMFTKAVAAGIGFGFFGDPLMAPALAWLNRTIPHWQKMLELRNTVLKGVPTNAQLTITLLRIGEANRAPLPPPPRSEEPPPDHAAELTDEHLQGTGDTALDASASEVRLAAAPDPNAIPKPTDTTAAADAPPNSPQEKHHASKISSKIVNLFKGTVAGGVKTSLATDGARGHVLRDHHARERLGVVEPAETKEGVPGGTIGGPVEFKARCGGKKGTVFLSTAATVPAVAFAIDGGTGGATSKVKGLFSSKKHDDVEKGQEAPSAEWSIAVGDISELRKFGGLGWKAKIVVGWSMGREVADGLEIKTVDGQTHKITACYLRDELFNRLVAMGGQKWEAW